MFVAPDCHDVRESAESCGLRLSDDDIKACQNFIAAYLRAVDSFMQTRVDEAMPPVEFPVRDRGYRPNSEEDPFNAWLWKCCIPGAEEGILAGKTVSFKDTIAVYGLPLTFGSLAMDGYIPNFDATVVTKVLRAGGTVIGKNAMDGVGAIFGVGGHIGDYPPPKNPRAPGHLTGGSSSGSAVAVAAGDVDISFGGDQGGSIRVPAAWSGTLGLKPTFGLISHFGVTYPSDPSIDYVGPLARTVEDVALGLQAVAGYDGLDPRQDRHTPDGIEVLATLEDGIDGLRVGLLKEGFEGADEGVRDAVVCAADILADAGARLSEVSVPEHAEAELATVILMVESKRATVAAGWAAMAPRTYYPESLMAALNRMWDDDAASVHPLLRLQHLAADFSRKAYRGRVYARIHNMRSAIARAYDRVLRDVDVLLMPTCLQSAPRVDRARDRQTSASGYGLADELRSLMNGGLLSTAQNTAPFNYSGHPALAVPCGMQEGLPVSMQLVGAELSEAMLLRVAYVYQHSVCWDEITGIAH